MNRFVNDELLNAEPSDEVHGKVYRISRNNTTDHWKEKNLRYTYQQFMYDYWSYLKQIYRFLSSVTLQMNFEHVFVCERFGTVRARVRALASVPHSMLLLQYKNQTKIWYSS